VIAVNNDDNAATAGPALSPQQLESWRVRQETPCGSRHPAWA
jgi:hypothetical protein